MTAKMCSRCKCCALATDATCLGDCDVDGMHDDLADAHSMPGDEHPGPAMARRAAADQAKPSRGEAMIHPPFYNHTREDSALTPCAECRTAKARIFSVQRAERRRSNAIAIGWLFVALCIGTAVVIAAIARSHGK